jgi:hypothetical protein
MHRENSSRGEKCIDGSRKYLSPEPMLQDPSFVRAMAKNGLPAPTYAYANNNPLRYVDRDGRQVTIPVPIPGIGPVTIPVPPSVLIPILVVWPAPTSDAPMPPLPPLRRPDYTPYLPQKSPNACMEKGGSVAAAQSKTCSQHYDACLDAHIANGWPPVFNCVECKRQCQNSNGVWPSIKESGNGDRYLCDYENPWTTPSGQ